MCIWVELALEMLVVVSPSPHHERCTSYSPKCAEPGRKEWWERGRVRRIPPSHTNLLALVEKFPRVDVEHPLNRNRPRTASFGASHGHGHTAGRPDIHGYPRNPLRRRPRTRFAPYLHDQARYSSKTQIEMTARRRAFSSIP